MGQKVLVTGGAGYIGSHVAKKLIAQGFEVVVYDNLTTGFREAIPAGALFVQGDVRNYRLLSETMQTHKIEAVVHFAAKLLVGESVIDPYSYYDNNIGGSLTLATAMRDNGIKKIVFSSTAAVYGDANASTGGFVNEDAITEPINPYGQTKLMAEQIFKDGHVAHDLNYMILRYFNVAGAALDGTNGQRTKMPTHLIKIASQVALCERPSMQIFGTDYPTADGTCIRDYIHVEDLADLHVLALQHMNNGGGQEIINAGYGKGFSVFDVVNTIKRLSAHDFEVVLTGRRPGDAAVLVADSSKAKKILDWNPKRDDISVICRSALEWEMRMLKLIPHVEIEPALGHTLRIL